MLGPLKILWSSFENVLIILAGMATSATADFSQTNRNGIQARNVIGHRLDNGNFIFSWIDGVYRKMVLTQNDGTTIKAGYLGRSDSTWKNRSKWQSTGYSISNFVGKQGQGILFFILFYTLFYKKNAY